MMPFVSLYTCCLRTRWPSGKMYSYFAWKPVNFIAEMQGCHALKLFVREGGMSFSRISHTKCLSGSVISCELKKNCRIYFQCSRNKNVIMVVYGTSDCGGCPVGH